MTSLSSTPSETRRIDGPAELLQAIPYLLGFHPAASLVLVGLDDGLLVVTARLDLADLAVEPLLGDTIAALARGGSTSVIAVVYDGDDGDGGGGGRGDLWRRRWCGLAVTMADEADAARCELLDLLVVAGSRWWSLLCRDEECCPAAGTPVPAHPSTFALAATVSGVAPLADRAALESTLDPAPEAERLPPALIDAAENDAVAAVLAGEAKRRYSALLRSLRAAARASDHPGPALLDPAVAASWVVALSDKDVRGELWRAVDARRLDGRPLWRELARRAPGPYRATPLFLFGWASWRRGDGALAGIAADRAVVSDPEYSPADLLHAVISQCVDPKTVPPLRLPGLRDAGGETVRKRDRRRRDH